LAEARAAGLKLRAEGGLLHVRGPLALEPIVRRLFQAKIEVLAALQDEQKFAITPSRPCRLCDGHYFWSRAGGAAICSRCHPCPSPDLVAEEFTITATPSKEVNRLLERFGWEPA